jgi:hypothetical protein
MPTTESLDRAVKSHVTNESDRLLLQNGRGWLIHFAGTTVELSNLLTITGHEKGAPSQVGSVIVTLVSSYYGIAPTHMWEWVQTRVEK